MKVMVAVLALGFLLCTSPSWAFSWYIGGGMDAVGLEMDSPATGEAGEPIGDLGSGTGLVFNSGFKFTSNFSLDLTLGISSHEWEGAGVGYLRMGAGPKFQLRVGPFVPYLGLGLMAHLVSIDAWVYDPYGSTWFYATEPYEVSGTGLYLGGGFDLFLAPRSSVGVSFLGTTWRGEDDFGYTFDVETGIVRFVYLHNF